jgi:hypothetical protein
MQAEPSEPTFTPAADVIEVYKDGSGETVVARAGEPMIWTRALMLGLVEGEAPNGFWEYASGVWEHHPRLPGETDEELFARLAGPPIDPAMLDTLHGVDVPPGDLAADLAQPRTIKRPRAKRHASDR